MTGHRKPSTAILRAILWMLAGGAAYTVMGALAKHLTQTLPIAVIVFFRMAIALLMLLPWIHQRGIGRLATSRPGLHLVRSATGFLALTCLVFALSRLILADAIALSFTTPLWMVIVAAVLLGETGGRRRAVATAVGFAGVLVIVRPHLDPDPAMLAALTGAFMGSVSLAIVRKLSHIDSPFIITFYFSFLGTLFSAIPALLAWTTPTPLELLFLVSVGICGVVGVICGAQAYSLAEATVVSPVDFTRLPMAAMIGFFVFDELPDAWTLSGTAIIMLSVIYIGRRAKRPEEKQ